MTTTQLAQARPAATTGSPTAVVAGSLAMAFVGSSVAVSALLADAPMHTAQALRYAVACGLLVGWARVRGAVVPRPRGAEWAWLAGVVATGLVVFNIGLVEGSAHAEPAVLAVAVASVPILLGVIGPLIERQRPAARVVVAAAVVTAGAALVQGFGRSDATGLVWAVVVMACEAGFTLLAVPVLRRIGPLGVSVWTTAIAAAAFAALGIELEGPPAVTTLTATDLGAAAYLAITVTAVAFVLWYSCVSRLGAARAGLLTGVAPVSAAAVGAALDGALPTAPVWLGIALVGAGLGIGLTTRSRGLSPTNAPERGSDRPTRGVAGSLVPEGPPAKEPAQCPERTSPEPRPPSVRVSCAARATRSTST